MFHAISAASSGLFKGAIGATWQFGRGFADGLTGKTASNGMRAWKDSAGNNVQLNPAQKLARRLRANAQQMVTGNKYDVSTMKAKNTHQGFLGRHVGNRIAGGLHLAGNLTLGTAGTALGWGTRIAGGAAFAASRPLLRATGHVAFQGAEFTAGTVRDVAKGVFAMNQSGYGKEILFGLGAAGALGIGMKDAFTNGMASDFASGVAQKNSGLGFYYGGSIDSAPGTLASQGAGPQSNMMVDTGADGNLVLALHQLR